MKNLEFLATLNKYKEEGKLYSQVHPSLPLTIWNYTPEVQYKDLWDDITLMCRGLVTDDTGRIWARPFKKFFNLEENRYEPTDDFEVFEKLDGSLIIVFEYNDEMIVASRGSFTSDHAMKAREILDQKYPDFERREVLSYAGVIRNDESMQYHRTYCFELIGFEQIVISYPEPDLLLTSIFLNDGNDSWNRDDTKFDIFGETSCIVAYTGIRVVKKFEGLDWKNIKDLNWKNSEGFVVRFSNGSRCKIKFEDYIRLHRVMTNISEKRIWEALKDGTPISSILENVPDEFFEEVKKIEDSFSKRHWEIESEYLSKFKSIRDHMNTAPTELKNYKSFAYFASKTKYPAILFSMLDGKDYSQKIWKIIEP